MAAKQRQQAREYRYASDSLKYWNKETTWLKKQDAAAIGFSRARSDAYQRAMSTLAQGRKTSETAQINYAKAGFKSTAHQAGRARTAGQTALRSLLRTTGDIENAVELGFNRNYDAYMHRNIQTLQNYKAKAHKELGLKPEWGPPVMMPDKDTKGQMFNSAMQGLTIAATVAAIPGAMPFLGNMFGGLLGASGAGAAAAGGTVAGASGAGAQVAASSSGIFSSIGSKFTGLFPF